MKRRFILGNNYEPWDARHDREARYRFLFWFRRLKSFRIQTAEIKNQK